MLQAKIHHVIYDMDGLLLDTEPFYTAVTQQIVSRYGKTFDWSVKANMIGRPAIESARYLVAALALPITPEQYLHEREQMLFQLLPTATAKPGARQLIRQLYQQGIPQAVATSSPRALFDLKTQQHQEWFALFDCVVTGDDPDVKQGKPAPDIFLTAAQRLGADPANCLVFEDAPSGLEAALAAGMAVVAVPEPEMDLAAYTEAHEVLASLEEFNPDQWGL